MLLYLLVFLIFLWLILRWKRRNVIRVSKQLKSGFTALPVIGHTYMMMGSEEDVMKTFQCFGRKAIEKGGIISLWNINTLYVVVGDPIPAEIILKTCLEKDDVMKVTSLIIGNGSIIAPVPIWRPRRKALAPAFAMKNLVRFVDIFAQQGSAMADQMRSAQDRGPVSVWHYITSYTMNSVCGTTLGVRGEAQQAQPFLVALADLFRIGANRIVRPWLHSDFVFNKLKEYKTAIKHKRLINDFVDKIIYKAQDREKNVDIKERRDRVKTIVELLAEAKSCSFDNIAVREECLVILFAGTDTSAISTAFTSLLLARRQDVQEKVVKELREVFGDSNRPVKAEDLLRLRYLEAVIKESMRLYPPAPVLVRKIDKDVKLPSGITIPAGCGAIINVWAIHRNPEYWGEDAEEFKPERFLDSNPKHPAAYLSFSYGPRACIGYQYAMMSMKTALATLLRRYRVTSPPDDVGDGHLRVKFDIMMRHVDDYRVTIHPREWDKN